MATILVVPNRVAAAANVIAHFDPKRNNHVNNNRWAKREATCINEKQANVFDGHSQFFTQLWTNSKRIGFNKKFKIIYLKHLFIVLFWAIEVMIFFWIVHF